MWVYTKDGFFSAVQDNQDRARMRVRARRRDDLERAFPDSDIIDQAESGGQFDYRWHLDVARGEWVDYLCETAMDIDYTSHAKEAMTQDGTDREMYSALLEVWRVMYRLQGASEPVDEFGWDYEDDDEDEVSLPAE